MSVLFVVLFVSAVLDERVYWFLGQNFPSTRGSAPVLAIALVAETELRTAKATVADERTCVEAERDAFRAFVREIVRYRVPVSRRTRRLYSLTGTTRSESDASPPFDRRTVRR